jgi:hypothetical protein
MNGVWTSTEDMTIVLRNFNWFSLGAESIALLQSWWWNLH